MNDVCELAQRPQAQGILCLRSIDEEAATRTWGGQHPERSRTAAERGRHRPRQVAAPWPWLPSLDSPDSTGRWPHAGLGSHPRTP